MALTRRQLRRLELPPDKIDAVLRLHADSVNTLRQERDAWRNAAGEADQLRHEVITLRTQVDSLRGSDEAARSLQAQLDAEHAERAAADRARTLHTAASNALRRRGANERAIPLLMQSLALHDAALA